MKKLILVLVGVVLLLAAGLGIFIATFNADQYRSLAAQKIEQVIGKKVELGKLSLGFENGIALQIAGLAIFDTNDSKNPSLSADRISAVVQLLPLLKKDLQVASIIISRPYVEIEKSADGSMKFGGINPDQAKNQSKSSQPAGTNASPALALAIDSIRVEKAQIVFNDANPSHPMRLTVKDFDLEVHQFSLNKAFSFKAAAALFSASQNIDVKGRFRIPDAAEAGYLKDFELNTSLEQWDLNQAAQALPTLANLPLKESPRGRLNIRVEHVDLGAPAALNANVVLKEGFVALRSLPDSFKDVTLNAQVMSGNLKIDDFSAEFAGGQIDLSGVVNGFQSAQPRSRLKAAIKGLSLEKAVLTASPNAPRLGGRVSLDFEGEALGFAWPEISQTLNGQGRLALTEGVIFNFNIARQVLEKLSVIPGIMEKLDKELPENYKSKLFAIHTFIQPLDFPFVIQNGQVPFENLRVVTDYVSIVGSGRFGLDSSIESNAQLQMSREISSVMMKSVSEISVLSNSQNEIEIPVIVRGKSPDISALPDLNIIASRFAAGKAQEVIGDLLSKALKKNEPAAETQAQVSAAPQGTAQPQGEAQPLSKEEQLISGFLGSLQSKEE